MPATAGFLGFSLAGILFRSRRNSVSKNGDLRSATQGAERTKTLKESITSSNNNLFPNSTMAAPTSSAEALIQTTKRQHQTDRLEPFVEDPLTSTQGERARGQQAEALLRSALKRVPQPLALHIELMDLSIARKDIANFQNLAIEALTITGGYGSNWERICAKGHSIDPQNLLYQLTAVNPIPQAAA
jgi:Tfp pilus assembly protein FimV